MDSSALSTTMAAQLGPPSFLGCNIQLCLASVKNFHSNPRTRIRNYKFSIHCSTQLQTVPAAAPEPRTEDPEEEVEVEEEPADSPLRLLRELEEKKKLKPRAKKKDAEKYRLPMKTALFRTPMDDERLARRFLNSPQLSLKTFPLLSSCLPNAPLRAPDQAWMEDNLLEAKQALGYPLETLSAVDESSPASQLDTMLYLAFQHEGMERGRKIRSIRAGHSRLAFLGNYVLELGLCEFLLQRYPREGPALLRERAFGMVSKRMLPYWLTKASLDNLIFPNEEITKLKRFEREPITKSVFHALVGGIYVCFGMAEIYRILFEVFGMDPDCEDCKPSYRREADFDHVSAEFEGKQLTWQDLVSYKRPPDALFAYPRLFRVCVPPGMHRFHGNIWEVDALLHVQSGLGYPLPMPDEIPEVTNARNIELALGLQLCFLHPSKYKAEHPRFCFERFEYLGQKIQDIVMAERLLMKYLDAPGKWIQERHRRLMMNRWCGRYLREKGFHKFIVYSDKAKLTFQENRILRNRASTAVQQALHGLAYTVYGKPEVRRLMFEYFDFEQIMPKTV